MRGFHTSVSTKLLALSCFLLLCLSPVISVAQSYTDGPIELRLKLREVNTTFSETDAGIFGIGFRPDELTYKIWGRDNGNFDALGWVGGTCLQQNFSPPMLSNDFNHTFYTFTYLSPTVPQFFDLRLDAFEDDLPSDALLGFCSSGSRCDWNSPQCCGIVVFGACVGITTGDDQRCNSNPLITGLDYRLGPPCTWYDHGFINGGCVSYKPHVESFWRYTQGTDCSNPIVLGNFGPGSPVLSHFNSNECYSNNWTASPGNDVWYQFNVSAPMGVVMSLCAAATFNTNLYLLDNTCTQLQFDDNFCGTTSEIRIPICNPGTYNLVIDGDAALDLGTFTITIQEDPLLIVNANAGTDQTICVGTSVVIGATPTAVGGNSPYTYSWTPTTNISNPAIANPQVFPTTTTDYIIVVTDSNNCVARDTMTVTVNPGPVVNLGNDTVVCTGDTVLLDAGPGFLSYFWSTGANTQTIDAIFPIPYFVTVIDLNGCQGKDTFNLGNHPLPNMDLGPDTSICLGANVVLDAGPGFLTYVWSTGAGSQQISVATAGQYYVDVTDFNFCSTSDSINVGINPLPTVSLGVDQTVCPGISVTLDPGPGYASYTWSNGSSNQTLTTTIPGAYWVRITDFNGCEAFDTASVFNFILPVANLGPDISICSGAPIILDAGPGFSTYNWNTGATTQTINVSFPGTYFVSVTDANGCPATDTIDVTIFPSPTVYIGVDTTICAGANLVLDAGGGVQSYLWSNGAITQQINVISAGNYSVTITDFNGCTATDDINVTTHPGPTPYLGNDTTICQGQFVLLNPGSGFATCVWNTGSTNHTILVSVPGLYTVTVTDFFGCISVEDILISNFSNPSVNIGPDIQVCAGGSVMLDAGPGYASYNWSTGDLTQQINISFPGTYWVEVTNANGCMARDTLDATFFPLPSVDLGADTVMCQNSGIFIDAGSGYASYTWSNGGTTQKVFVTAPGTYSVIVTDGNGCQASDDINVSLDPPLIVNLGGNVNICDSGMVMLDAGAGLSSYLWNDGSTNQWLFALDPGTYSVQVTNEFGCTGFDQIKVSATGLTGGSFLGNDTSVCSADPYILDAGEQFILYKWDNGLPDQYRVINAPGTYQVEVQDSNGCRFTDEIIISFSNPPQLQLQNKVLLCPDRAVELDAGAGFLSYEWNTGQLSQSIDVNLPGTYSVIVDDGTCMSIGFFSVEDTVGDTCSQEIFVPNAFSPNHDWLNDKFDIKGIDIEDFHLIIFDRWNKEIFESFDMSNSWNGNYSGSPMPEGVYVYRLEFRIRGIEEIRIKSGSIQLLR